MSVDRFNSVFMIVIYVSAEFEQELHKEHRNSTRSTETAHGA